MHTDHYGLARRPFQTRPNPAFLFAGRAHRRAIGCVALALRQDGGLAVVTGGPGTGKSILLGYLEAALARPARRLVVARVAAGPGTAAAHVPGLVAGALGLERGPLQGDALARLVTAELDALRRAGRRALLAVDDAHLLNDPALEALRALAAAGGDDRAHLLLLGDGTFRERLARPPLERLRRWTAASAHLDPLGPDEVGPYLEHRLRRAGWTGRPALAPDLPAALAELCGGGVPGLVNPLAARLLLHGALAGRDRLEAADARRIAADDPADPDSPAPFALGAAAGRALALAAPAAAARGLALRIEPPALPPPAVLGRAAALEAALLDLLRRGMGRVAAPPPSAAEAAAPPTLTLALDHEPARGGALLARFSLRGPGGDARPDLRLERRLEVADPGPPDGPGARAGRDRLRVLVAEDPVFDQLLIRDMLRRRRHEAVLADSGTEAVSLAGRQRFDLVLVGARMAPVDGLEATRRIRELPSPAGRVPVVALAADASAAARRRCREAGADHVLAKPVTWAGLSRALASVAALPAPAAGPARGPAA